MSHKDRIYTIYFMRGDKKVVVSPTESDALRVCYRKYPETRSWDILKIDREE